MECTVKRINADTFKIEGEIEVRFTHDQMVSDLKEFFRAELEKQRVWLKEALKTIKEEKSMKPTKRLLTVKETAQYLGISPGTIYNKAARGSKNPFPVKPKRVGRRGIRDMIEKRIGRRIECECQVLNDRKEVTRRRLWAMFGADFGESGKRDMDVV